MRDIQDSIQQFTHQMVTMGYVEGEVNAFLHEQIGDRKISDLDSYEIAELIEYMQCYLAFAVKSKGLVNQ